jgi:hypothetical protein
MPVPLADIVHEAWAASTSLVTHRPGIHYRSESTRSRRPINVVQDSIMTMDIRTAYQKLPIDYYGARMEELDTFNIRITSGNHDRSKGSRACMRRMSQIRLKRTIF